MTLRQAAIEAMARAEHASDCAEENALLALRGEEPRTWADPWHPASAKQRKRLEHRAAAALDALRALLRERGMRVVPEVATTFMLSTANTTRVSSGGLFYTHMEAECLDEEDLALVVNAALAASADPLEDPK